jgi:preprotein translocase subunit SecB
MTEQQSNDENTTEQQAAQQAGQGPAFAIQRVYMKDLSFESPHAPEIFLQEWDPKVNVEMDNSVNMIEEGVYDVQLKITVTAKINDKVAYIAEVVQGGIFTIMGFSEKEQKQITGAACPGTLYPYAREALSDIIAKGSYPTFMLAPVNFDFIYGQHKQQREQQQETA